MISVKNLPFETVPASEAKKLRKEDLSRFTEYVKPPKNAECLIPLP